MNPLARLRGATDIHVHVPPDMGPRAQAVPELLADAAAAEMAGIVLKSHTACTADLAGAMNDIRHAMPELGWPRCYGTLALNPTVGGLNPYAVEAACRQGVGIVYMPTYGAGAGLPHQAEGFSREFPRPKGWGPPGGPGIRIWDEERNVLPVVHEMLEIMADLGREAVLATGHLAPDESLALLKLAVDAGVPRLLVSHGATVGMPIALQQEAAALGAMVEQTFECTAPLDGDTAPWGDAPSPPSASMAPVSMAALAAQIRAVGPERTIVSSDFGQPANGPVVAGYARYLQALAEEGIAEQEIERMIVTNPAHLLG